MRWGGVCTPERQQVLQLYRVIVAAVPLLSWTAGAPEQRGHPNRRSDSRRRKSQSRWCPRSATLGRGAGGHGVLAFGVAAVETIAFSGRQERIDEFTAGTTCRWTGRRTPSSSRFRRSPASASRSARARLRAWCSCCAPADSSRGSVCFCTRATRGTECAGPAVRLPICPRSGVFLRLHLRETLTLVPPRLRPGRSRLMSTPINLDSCTTSRRTRARVALCV